MESIAKYFKVENVNKIYKTNSASNQFINLINQPVPVQQFKASLNFMNVRYISKFIKDFNKNLNELKKSDFEISQTLNSIKTDEKISDFFKVIEYSSAESIKSIDIKEIATGEIHTGKFLNKNKTENIINSKLYLTSKKIQDTINFKKNEFNNTFDYLNYISAEINSQSNNFKAKVELDNFKNRIHIENKNTGLNSNFTISGDILNSIGFNKDEFTIKNGSDSLAIVNEETIHSKSNKISLLSGIKINLKQQTNTPLQFKTINIEYQLNSFVDNYNNLINQLSFSNNNPVLSNFKNNSVILNELYIDTLSSFGLSFNDSKLKFDTAPAYIDSTEIQELKNHMTQFESITDNLNINSLDLATNLFANQVPTTMLYSNQALSTRLGPFLGFGLYIDTTI